MTLQYATDRMTRGAVRVRNFVLRPSPAAEEYRIEGQTALHAVDMDTPEGDIQVATQRDAWTTQIARLEGIENRSRDQEMVLRQLRRNVRQLDDAEAARHPTPQNSIAGRRLAEFGTVGRPRGFLGPLAANPVLALLSSPAAWVALAFALPAGWGVWNHVRAGILERSLEAKEAELEATRRQAAEAATQRDMLAEAVTAADAQTRQSAETIEAERRRRQRAEAEARRIQREMEQARAGNSVDYGFGGVRNDQPSSGAAGADHNNTGGGGAR